MALYKWKFLIAIEREYTRECRCECDCNGFPCRNLIPDVQSGSRIVNDDIVRYNPGYALEGQFNRCSGFHDEVMWNKRIAVNFYYRALNSIRVERHVFRTWTVDK